MFIAKNYKVDSGALRGNSVKNAFQNLAKSEKIAEHEGTEYHQRSWEKAESFLRTFENLTEAVNHEKKRESNYERNVHILKMLIEAVILCAEQGLASRGHRDHGKPASDDDDDNMKKVYQGNFLAIVNTFAKFDTILKDHIEQGSRNAKMLSWNIQNDIISCLAEFVRDRIKEHISKSTYYAIIADEVTERYSNKEVLLICLRYLRYINGEPRIYETFFDSTHIKGRPTGQTIGKTILEILENNRINVADCRAQAYDVAKVMSS